MKIATITPTRRDRPQLLQRCKHYIHRQHRKPYNTIIVDYPPTSTQKDLTQRVRIGIQTAKDSAAEWVTIIEDDDYYSSHYLFFLDGYMRHSDYDAIGWESTYYYHLKRGYMHMHHPNRSSLFCTSIRLSALHGFTFPPDDYVSLDVELWKFLSQKRKCLLFKRDEGIQPIGIKHGIGLCGGKGHTIKSYKPDPNMEWLKNRIGTEYKFYEDIIG